MYSVAVRLHKNQNVLQLLAVHHQASVTLVKIYRGKRGQRYSSYQPKTYNTDFSSHTPRSEAYAESGKILYHKVANGETLESIAKQHGITLDQICRLNRLGRFTRVVEGQLLTISK